MQADHAVIKKSLLPARVSVIIPTCERWDLLSDALQSIVGQTFPHWEAVVVNDGTGKPSGKAAELLDHPRVTYVEHRRNMGRSAARNTGLACSSGEYIAYLDDDDIFYPSHLETLVKALKENGWDVAYTDACKGVYENCDGTYNQVSKAVEYSTDFDPERLLYLNYIPIICLAHKKDCLQRSGGFDTTITVLEDWDLWLRMSSSYVFHHLPLVTSEYRVRLDRTNTTTSTDGDLWDMTAIAIYDKLLANPDFMQDARLLRIVRSRVSRRVRRVYMRAARLSWNDLASRYDKDLADRINASDWFSMFLKMPLMTIRFMWYAKTVSNLKLH